LAAGLWGDPCGPGVNGVYWKPVWNLLEGQFEVLLVNAQHIKAVAHNPRQPEKVWSTAEASYPLCTMQLAHFGFRDSVP